MPESEQVKKLRERRELLEQRISVAWAAAHSREPAPEFVGKDGRTQPQRQLDQLRQDATILDAEIQAAIRAGL
jgi:hypothetical protein